MSRQWTENQKLAIEARGGSLLVSAAAGSGKTAVLVERVTQMVSDADKPVPIERLLIVTYTRAAAAELKERISKTLNELIKKDPSNKWYRRQLTYLPRANISTVDSFCSEVVKEFFQKLNVPRDYRLLDNGELTLFVEDAMERTLEHFYCEGSTDFFRLVETFATPKDDKKLQQSIYRLYEFLRSHPFADKWLSEKQKYYTEFNNIADSVWGRVVLDYAESAIDYCIDQTNASLNIAEAEPELYSLVSALFLSDLQYLETLKEKVKNESWSNISAYSNTFSAGRLAPKGYTNHPIKEQIANNRNDVKKIIKKLQELFVRDEAETVKEVSAQSGIVIKMFQCVRTFGEYFSKAKLAKNTADFSDVMHWTLDLLVACDEKGDVSVTEVADMLSERYDAVMVDEFQDANEVQDLIFNAVSKGGKNLFVVGDVKQSIYRFRQAMPEIFLGRKNVLPMYSPDVDSYPAKVILECNFRSRKEITDFVNFVFTTIMSERIGDMEYSKEEHLVAAATYPEADSPCNELHLLDLEDDDDIDSAVTEARYIASVIYEKCSNTYVKDGDAQRLLRFGDIAILMRNKSTYGDVYASELRKLGIPVYLETDSGFLKSPEIRLVMDFLRVVDNPLQDIPLLTMLMSPVYGFTPDDMAQMRAQSRKLPLYMSLKAFAQSGCLKFQRFLAELEVFRNLACSMPSDAFIFELYEKTNMLSIAGATDGALAVDNLRLLCEYAKAYEQGASKGISAFVSYIDRLIENKKDLTPATVQGNDNANMVRIMTIHGSKGLEFPLVILANNTREFKSDTKDNVLLHPKLGFASKHRDEVLLCNYNTFPREAVSLEIKRNERSEEIRILYVALTRAKERLIMTVTKKNMQSYVEKLASSLADTTKLSPFVLRDSRFLSDWIVMFSLMHPDAENLRDYAGIDKKNFSVPASDNFLVKFADLSNLDTVSSYDKAISRIVYEDVPENINEIIKDRFDNFTYKYEDLCTLPQKVTASSLAHKDSSKLFSKILSKPKFMNDSALSSAEKGTAMHNFMQYCDFVASRQNLDAEIQRLVSTKRLTDAQAQSLDKEKLCVFLASDIITSALSSEHYYREYRFTVNIPAYMADDNISEKHKNHTVILQGSVDLVISDKDGIIIVDYKTDRVKSSEELKELYQKQLLLYKCAVEQTMDKPVKSCLIYSVHLNESLEVL